MGGDKISPAVLGYKMTQHKNCFHVTTSTTYIKIYRAQNAA